MRVRVRSVGPLPTVNAWYEVSTGRLEQRTIADFKTELCQTLFNLPPTSHKTPLTPANIFIELDECELLGSSSLSLIHENDLLLVKYKVTPVSGIKRKREEDEEKATVSKHKTKKRVVSSSSSFSSSSSSHSSTSTSSSSSDSDNSDSESDSDTDTPPSTIVSKATSQKTITFKRAQPLTQNSHLPVYPLQPVSKTAQSKAQQKGTSQKQSATATTTSLTFVPPGEGRLSTQQRNQRRRKRRIVEKAQDKGVAQEKEPSGMHSAPSTSTSVSTRQGPPTPTPATSAPDRSLALAMSMAHATKNDNKRRGFKGKVGADLGLISGAGHRTFTTGMTSSSTSPFKPSSAPRLVPPSERTNLPGNIIVTSVDVEWDLLPRRGIGIGTRTGTRARARARARTSMNGKHSKWG